MKLLLILGILVFCVWVITTEDNHFAVVAISFFGGFTILILSAIFFGKRRMKKQKNDISHSRYWGIEQTLDWIQASKQCSRKRACIELVDAVRTGKLSSEVDADTLERMLDQYMKDYEERKS